mmetsp:Transcript_90316/g.156414  ORF Transcript_90316/g.156414 Transcript_90316/m.156414 type:complete len:216 (-) Transcript_90316:7232-7879(-)
MISPGRVIPSHSFWPMLGIIACGRPRLQSLLYSLHHLVPFLDPESCQAVIICKEGGENFSGWKTPEYPLVKILPLIMVQINEVVQDTICLEVSNRVDDSLRIHRTEKCDRSHTEDRLQTGWDTFPFIYSRQCSHIMVLIQEEEFLSIHKPPQALVAIYLGQTNNQCIQAFWCTFEFPLLCIPKHSHTNEIPMPRVDPVLEACNHEVRKQAVFGLP